MNPYTLSGLLAGVFLGFLLGRSFSEYFRAVAAGRAAQRDRKNYRGGTFAWYVGALLVLGGVLLFGRFGGA